MITHSGKAAGSIPAAFSQQAARSVKDHPLYRTWLGMMMRCYLPCDSTYERYGGRGITVDPAWHDPAQFIRDVGEKPSSKHSLDRIDVNSLYSKENTRWASAHEQANNKCNTIYVDVDGERLPFSIACEKYGVNYGTATDRRIAGWTSEQIFDLAPTPMSHITHEGETHTIAEWARIRKIHPGTLRRRYEMKYPVEQILGFVPVEWNRRFMTGRSREMHKPRAAFGRSQKLADWAREFGMRLNTLCFRLGKGMELEEALQAPVRKRKVQ